MMAGCGGGAHGIAAIAAPYLATVSLEGVA